MTPEPPSKPRPGDFSVLNRLNATAVAYWFGMLAIAGALLVHGFTRGPDSPIYGLALAFWTFFLGPGVAIPVTVRVPQRWHHVPAGERLLHRMLGVGAFGWMLERSGYNRRFVHPLWDFDINRAGLPQRVQAARGGSCAHGVSFAIHLAWGGAALVTGHPWGAAWILLPGVALHLYPVLLQRSIMLRLQPLLSRSNGPRTRD